MTVERIPITSRDQWLAARRQDVTASVAGALLGVHPYATAYGLYLQKGGLLDADAEETSPMRRGRLLEPAAVQMLREDRPEWKLEEYPVGLYYRDPEARLGATPDVLCRDEKGRLGVVQLKSVEPSIFRRDWSGSDELAEPPLWIVVQAIVEAHLTGAEWAAVAAMVVSFGVDLHIVPVPIHTGIIDRIKGLVGDFWTRIAAKNAYAPDYGRDGALIAKLYPTDDGSEVDLFGDNELPSLVDQLTAARAAKKDAEGLEKSAKAGIAAKMGAASFARVADGRRISNKLIRRGGYAVGPTEFRTMKVLA